MRLRYWTALASIVSVGTILTVREVRQAQTLVAPMGAPFAGLQDMDTPVETDAKDQEQARSREVTFGEGARGPQPLDGEFVTWSRVVSPGESLDVLLAKAGLDIATRAVVSNAIGSEFDLRKLKPGHRLDLELQQDGLPRLATLEVDSGVNIQAVFGEPTSVTVLPPELETMRQAAETEIETSIYAALDKANIPTRFATDLELVFAGTLDLQRELVGGEHLRVVWRENRLDDRVIGEPMIDFVELDLGEAKYEVVWPGDASRQTHVLKDGRPLFTFVQPIKGARLSSAFGLRQHPVHGNVRMHQGVDFAAEEGATVYATQSGRVSFIGRRSGYGLMIEIEHAQDIRTVYAHLSAVNEPLEVDQRIPAGHEIGHVGSTGTSTGPHLHYDVVIEDLPVPPLTDTRLSRSGDGTQRHMDVSVMIEAARDQLASLLAANG
ncbi:M23 family metallopeptidase [uncultured Roseovarius sp.]|uniref:M23 family metallopeptidase n=1 Tax=uncultured Roseovarius sp. TaxID=293344 RepID=UPI0026180D8D|nr:M23 family metallopeptidase [uncultured Roseovarius sp.]